MGIEFLIAQALLHDKGGGLLAHIAVVPGFIPAGKQQLAGGIALDKAVLGTVLVKPCVKLLIHFAVHKAGALLVGIALCAIVYAASVMLGFTVLESIFGAIIGSGALVIVILLQPEIREALEKMGNGSINSIATFSDRKKKKELYYNVIENVCDAVRELSAESTGALIVLERTSGLADITQTGIVINADVNSSLLRNLFYNKAPLHDGAVIIGEARIVAAGCFLPLTRRSDVDPDLGTRHRAAIGMSESSDAIVVVVSEETGSISIAHDCALMRNLTIDELRSFLMEKILRVSGNLSR